MNLAEAVALVQQGLGFRTDLAPQITNALREAQSEFEGANRTLPKFLIQEDQPITLVANDPTFALPERFLREVEDEGPNYLSNDSGYIYLRKLTKSEADQYYASVDPGRPQAYVRRVNSLRFYPTPDIAYSLQWSYFRAETFPGTDAETNAWFTNWPYLLIGKAGMLMARDTRQAGTNQPYEKFVEQFNTWNTKWMAYLAADEDANMPRAMGLNN